MKFKQKAIRLIFYIKGLIFYAFDILEWFSRGILTN